MFDLPPSAYVSVITFICALAGAWTLSKYRLDKSEDTDKDQWAIITKIREWQSAHDKESLTVRIDYEKRIGDINSSIREVKAQHSDILRRMDMIDSKLDKLFDLMSKRM